jgi:hypothetical protein
MDNDPNRFLSHERGTLNDAAYRGVFDEPHEDAYL